MFTPGSLEGARHLVARHGGTIRAALSLVDTWDARQNVLIRMPRSLGAVVGALRLLERIVPVAHVPGLGEPIRTLYVKALACVDGDDGAVGRAPRASEESGLRGGLPLRGRRRPREGHVEPVVRGRSEDHVQVEGVRPGPQAGARVAFSRPIPLICLPSPGVSLRYLCIAFAPLFPAFAAFIIAMLAETARFPFDNPATHLELTMIHEAMILEYSGKRLALMEWAAANKFLIFIALGANLFFPWGIALSAQWVDVLLALVLFLAKALVFCLFVAMLESSIAKSRFFRLPNLLFISFILSVIAITFIV